MDRELRLYKAITNAQQEHTAGATYVHLKENVLTTTRRIGGRMGSIGQVIEENISLDLLRKLNVEDKLSLTYYSTDQEEEEDDFEDVKGITVEEIVMKPYFDSIQRPSGLSYGVHITNEFNNIIENEKIKEIFMRVRNEPESQELFFEEIDALMQTQPHKNVPEMASTTYITDALIEEQDLIQLVDNKQFYAHQTIKNYMNTNWVDSFLAVNSSVIPQVIYLNPNKLNQTVKYWGKTQTLETLLLNAKETSNESNQDEEPTRQLVSQLNYKFLDGQTNTLLDTIKPLFLRNEFVGFALVSGTKNHFPNYTDLSTFVFHPLEGAHQINKGLEYNLALPADLANYQPTFKERIIHAALLMKPETKQLIKQIDLYK